MMKVLNTHRMRIRDADIDALYLQGSVFTELATHSLLNTYTLQESAKLIYLIVDRLRILLNATATF